MNIEEMNADALRDFATTEDLIEAVMALRAERDSLAAHVEDIKNAHKRKRGVLRSREERASVLSAVGQVIRRGPATSLARRDAQIMAEAIRETANDLSHELNRTQVRMLRDRAAMCSRQAEEADQ